MQLSSVESTLVRMIPQGMASLTPGAHGAPSPRTEPNLWLDSFPWLLN